MKAIRLLVLTLLAFPLVSAAERHYYSLLNAESAWKMLVLDTTNTAVNLTSADTVIIVASNRKPDWHVLRFMGEVRADGPVRYFLIYSHEGKWNVRPEPSLEVCISLVPQRDRDWLIYTEGMGKIFTTGLGRGMNVSGQYGLNVLLLDYPSIRTTYKSFRNYHFAYRNACSAYEDFVPVIDTFRSLKLAGRTGNGRLSLFFHSMGNNVMRKIVQENLLFMFNTQTTPWVDNIVLNAPCVPRHRSKQWVGQINFARRIYVDYNPHDGTLKWARVVGFRQVMGEHAKHPATNALYINFNTLCGPGHSNFINIPGRQAASPEALAYYNKVLHGESVDLQDNGRYRRSVYRGIGWDILPQRQ